MADDVVVDFGCGLRVRAVSSEGLAPGTVAFVPDGFVDDLRELADRIGAPDDAVGSSIQHLVDLGLIPAVVNVGRR